MSGKTHRKRNGHRKAKRVLGMRADEMRRHAESGVGYSVSRGEPHVGHTRRQQGAPIAVEQHVDRPDRTRTRALRA